jgi:hypothetical protein
MSKIIYTLEAIDGIVEYAFPPVKTRVAKETLAAIIEEKLIKRGYASSYSMTNSEEFPFPFDKPNIMALNGFFGQNPDFNLIAREVNILFEQPRSEISAAETQLLADLEAADNDQLVAMVEKYHWEREGTRNGYEEALKKFNTLWGDFNKLGENIRKVGFSSPRSDLLRVLNVLDNCQVLSLIEEIQKAKKSLGEEKRDEVVEQIKLLFSNWRRKNLAKLYNACGDAKFYGAGYWIARIIAVEGEVEVPARHTFDNPHKTAEAVLISIGMPCQVIEL